MFVKSVSFLHASIESMNPMQKYPHITELFACTRKMLAIMFLFLTNSFKFLINFLQSLQKHVYHRNY